MAKEQDKSSKKEKGDFLESFHSETFHQEGTPLLVAPEILRSRGMGQIDLARVIKSKTGKFHLELLEVKTRGELGLKQKRRLLKSADFLSRVTGFSPFLKIVD